MSKLARLSSNLPSGERTDGRLFTVTLQTNEAADKQLDLEELTLYSGHKGEDVSLLYPFDEAQT